MDVAGSFVGCHIVEIGDLLLYNDAAIRSAAAARDAAYSVASRRITSSLRATLTGL